MAQAQVADEQQGLFFRYPVVMGGWREVKGNWGASEALRTKCLVSRKLQFPFPFPVLFFVVGD